MAGLQNIIDRILSDANEQAKEILADANAKAAEIQAEAAAESEQIAAGIQKKSASDVENYKKRVQSANDLYRRTETLASKQKIINGMISEAYERIVHMDRQSYFDMLEKLIGKYALAEDGEIYFSEKDLADMPGGFPKKISAAAKKAGGNLTLSRKGKRIDNGFILVYGGVEENCTIRALFDAKREEMQDAVNALLYGKEA